MVPSRWVLARVVAVVVLAVSARASAQPSEPIVLVGSDDAFASALDDALVPAGMDVVSTDIAAPPSAELPARSRELADRERATATVWLLPAPAGTTLVTYDRGVDRLLVRELPYRSPLSATQAAEAARAVRTMLRALRVPDDAYASHPPPPPPLPPPPAEPLLAASAGVAAWFLAPGNDSGLAANVALAWRPHGLGAAITALIAPAADVTTMAFAGQVRDLVVAAEVRYAVLVAPDVRITPLAGVAVHALTLEGSLGGNELTSRRYDPAVRLGIIGAYALPWGLDVGLGVSADGLLRRQKYEAATEQILVVPRLQIVADVMVGVRL